MEWPTESQVVWVAAIFLRRRHDLEPFERGLFEGLAVIGMRDLDERVCTLTNRLAKQIGDAELGGDVVDVRTAGDDSGAWKGMRIPYIIVL